MSDIWDEFEKIAVAQGLVVEADEEESQRKTPVRYDSLSDDAVRMLYNVEPETIFKDKDIIEVAHPETAVITRTYDAMNSVVENANQRQDMMAYIAQKMPNGHLIYRRYIAAKQELMNSLVKAAFTLDNNDDEKLMSFADSCAIRLDKESEDIVKKALGSLTLGIAAGASALLGGAYYLLYGSNTAQNVYINSQQVLKALQPLMSEPYAKAIYTDVSNLMKSASQVYDIKDELTRIRSVDDAIQTAKAADDAKISAVRKRINNYIKQLGKIRSVIPRWVSAIEIESTASKEESSDFMAKLKNIADPFYDTAEEELIDTLQGKSNWLDAGTSGGLQEAIAKDIQMMRRAMSTAQQKTPEINEIIESEQTPDPEIFPKTPTQPSQSQKTELPKPTPAPEPSMPQSMQQPIGGVARKNPNTEKTENAGFDPTGSTW